MHIFLEEKYLQNQNEKPLAGAKTNTSFATDSQKKKTLHLAFSHDKLIWMSIPYQDIKELPP